MRPLEELPAIDKEHLNRGLGWWVHTNPWGTELSMVDVNA